MMLPAPH